MRKKILVLPIHAGLAHLIRSIALAEELAKKYDVTIEIHEKKLPLFHLSPQITIIKDNEEVFDDVVRLFKIYLDNIGVKSLIDKYIKIINQVNPDLVISDLNPAAIIAAIIANKKHVMINNSEILPLSKGFPGWFSDAKTIPQKIIGRSTELFLDFWKRYFIGIIIRYLKIYDFNSMNINDLIRKTPTILPEIKEYVGLKKYLPNIHHVGPIIYDKIEARDEKLEKELKNKAKGKQTIYLTFGGTGFGKELLLQLIKILIDKNYFVIVATGNIVDPQDIKLQSKNLFARKFIPGFSACKIADIVLSHGSYGTVVQALHWGKPIVCVPFNIDHVFHGLKIKELGVGKSLISLRFHHFFMDTGKQQKMAEKLDPIKIVKTTEEVIGDRRYAINAQKFSKYFQKLDGVKNAAKIIEKILAL